MKAIVINGSPRKSGTSGILLKQVLAPLKEAVWETDFIQLGVKSFRVCQACHDCFKKKNSRCKNSRCRQKDDFFHECMEKMIEADAIILGSPTYFTDVCVEIKALLDQSTSWSCGWRRSAIKWTN